MGMQRFFISDRNIKNKLVEFPEDIQHQIQHVLRMNAGKDVIILDNKGSEYLVRLIEEGGRFTGDVLEKREIESEPSVCVALYFPLSQREKVELILQKGTEVGVSSFHPFTSRRTLVQREDISPNRRTRWERIVREAAEQSGRGWLPELHAPLDLKVAVVEAREFDGAVLAADVGADESLSVVVSRLSKGVKKISVLIGPEGGFEDYEIDYMKTNNVQLFSLGRRVLRMETAAVIVPALVLFTLDEMGGSE